MLKDFLKLDYNRCKNKLKTIRDLINRISIPELEDKIFTLDLKFRQLKKLYKQKELPY